MGGSIAPALKAQPVIFVSIAAVFNIFVRSYEAPIVTAVSEETSRNFVPATAAAEASIVLTVKMVAYPPVVGGIV